MADSEKKIWVLAEVSGGHLTSCTMELLGCASGLAESSSATVCAVIWGSDPGRFADELSGGGADEIIMVRDLVFDSFNDEIQAEMLKKLIGKYRPDIVLIQASMTGRALAPRVASLCHVGLTADCTELSLDKDTGALLQTRPAFGGSLLATIRSDKYLPQMATVRPGVMRALKHRKKNTKLIYEPYKPSISGGSKEILEEFYETDTVNSFEDAHVIVAGGRGLNGTDNFRLLKRFALSVGGALGATRAAVDANWVDYSHQIGQTGRSVQSRIYIACGISGQIQHLVGMQSSDFIIAINTDAEAPIMKIADIAIVGDAVEIIKDITKNTKEKDLLK